MIYEFRKPDNRDREEENIGNMLMGFILGLIACLLITLCSSCTTTKYVTVPEYHTDTVKVTNVQKDSVFLHDSTYVYEKGDTFLLEKWHTKYVLKEIHDTLYQSKTDTVPAPYPVIQEVPADLTWWQQTKMHVGAIVIFGLLIALFINIFIRFFKKRLLP